MLTKIKRAGGQTKGSDPRPVATEICIKRPGDEARGIPYEQWKHAGDYSWLKMKRLFVAATAIEFSSGCHARCRIFLPKSIDSTLRSSFFLRPRPRRDLVVFGFFLKAVQKSLV